MQQPITLKFQFTEIVLMKDNFQSLLMVTALCTSTLLLVNMTVYPILDSWSFVKNILLQENGMLWVINDVR